MKVEVTGQELVLKSGGLRSDTRIPLAEVTRWDMLYEVAGRRYLAFHLGDRTAYAQLPRLQPEQRVELVAELTRYLGHEPDIRLLDDERDNEHWLKVWAVIEMIGRYLRLFINPMRSPLAPTRPTKVPPRR